MLLVQRSLEDKLPVDCIVYTSDLNRQADGPELLVAAEKAGITCTCMSEGLLGKVTTSRPVPDVMATVNLKYPNAQDAFEPSLRTILIAENINNPDNLGMILRTADAAGAEQIVVVNADPFHKNCIRAARGAVGRVSLAGCGSLPDYVEFLKQKGVCVVGTALDADGDLFTSEMQQPTAVIVGNETSGITPEVLKACSLRVRIPMAAGQDSLNVGVSAGVTLYELWRRYRI